MCTVCASKWKKLECPFCRQSPWIISKIERSFEYFAYQDDCVTCKPYNGDHTKPMIRNRDYLKSMGILPYLNTQIKLPKGVVWYGMDVIETTVETEEGYRMNLLQHYLYETEQTSMPREDKMSYDAIYTYYQCQYTLLYGLEHDVSDIASLYHDLDCSKELRQHLDACVKREMHRKRIAQVQSQIIRSLKICTPLLSQSLVQYVLRMESRKCGITRCTSAIVEDLIQRDHMKPHPTRQGYILGSVPFIEPKYDPCCDIDAWIY